LETASQRNEWPKNRSERGGFIYTNAREKEVPGTPFWLVSFWERNFETAFRHKNTLATLRKL
jgi:hypothetical protein